MKKIILILALAIFPFFGNVALSQSQQDFESGTACIFANIVIPVKAEEYSKLNFGKFFPGKGGSIIVNPNGKVRTTSSVIIKDGTSTPGNFIVSGEISAAVSVSIPNTSTLITNENNQSMSVNNWNIDKEKNIRLNDGSQSISIGATLNVGSMDQNPKGVYTGTYQIVFSYN